MGAIDLNSLSDEELKNLYDKHAPFSSKGEGKVDLNSLSDSELQDLYNKHTAMGPVETGAKTALDTYALGYGPNIIAGAKTLGGTVGNYPKERDTQRAELTAGQKANPIASGVGTAAGVIGAIATPIPGMGEMSVAEGAGLGAKALNTAAHAGRGVLFANAMSALVNPGDVKGEVSGPQLEDRMKNVKDNATMNSIVGAGTGLISAKISSMAGNKEQLATKAIGVSPSSAAKLENKSGELIDASGNILNSKRQELANFVMDKGIVTPTATPTSIAANAAASVDKYGKQVSNVFNKYTPKVTDNNNIQELSDMVDKELGSHLANPSDPRLAGKSDTAKNVIDDIKSKIASRSDVNGNDTIKLNDLHFIRQSLQYEAKKYGAYNVDPSQSVKGIMYDNAANAFNNLIENKLKTIGPEVGDQAAAEMRISNRNYSLASLANKYAQPSAEKFEAAPSGLNLMDLGKNIAPIGLTGAGIVTHHPLAGLAAGATAVGAGALSPIMPAAKASIANSGPYMNKILNPAMGASAVTRGVMPPPPTLTESAKMIDAQRRKLGGK